MSIQKTILAITLSAAFGAMAQTAPAAPESSLTYNLGVFSEYRYRGIAQTAKKPAVQGGFDYADKSGAYVGVWASNINWIKDSDPKGNAKGPVEIDVYGGYKGNLSDAVAYDVGGLQYWYSGNTLNTVPGAVNANTFELYLALSSGPFAAKVSNSMTNLFGAYNSKNSRYLDLSYTADLGDGLTLVPHLGDQYVANNSTSYSDYSLALNKDLDGTVISATVIGTNYKNRHGDYLLPGTGSKELSGTTLVLGLKKNF